MGRPGTPGDARAVELGLRTKRCADSVRQLIGDLQPLMSACHLVLPSAAAMGLDLPPNMAGAAGP